MNKHEIQHQIDSHNICISQSNDQSEITFHKRQIERLRYIYDRKNNGD